jgi:hypothetical protein
VDKEQDDLIEAKPDQKGQPGRNAGMPHMRPIAFTPPLGDDDRNEKGNSERGGYDHAGIQKGIAAGE